MTLTTHLPNCSGPALCKRVTRTERLTKKELRALKQNLLIFLPLNLSSRTKKLEIVEQIVGNNIFDNFFDACVKECFHVRYIFILSYRLILSTHNIQCSCCMEQTMHRNPFLANVRILYPLSTPGDSWFSGVFR